MMDLDAAVRAVQRPGSPFAAMDPALLRAFLAAHLARGEMAASGPVAAPTGFIAWRRMDRLGVDLLRQFGWIRLTFLAIPLAESGPILFITMLALSGPPNWPVLLELWRMAQAANPGASRMVTCLETRRGPRWVERGL